MAKGSTTQASVQTDRQPISREGLLGIIGVCSIVLGQIATILSNIEKIRSQVMTWIGANELVAVHDGIKFGAPAAVGLGFALVGWWIYATYFRKRSKLWRVAAALFIAAGAPAVALVAYYAVDTPSPVDLLHDQADRLSSTIAAQQLEDGSQGGGGFRFSIGSAAPEVQAWTTAQCLVALLTGPLDGRTRGVVRKGLDYLARARVPDQGWGMMPGDDRGVTEVNAWAALAEIMSLAPRKEGVELLTPEERTVMTDRIFLELDLLAARQNRDGGWGPAPRTNRSEHNRTYSTALALWAMTEARSNKSIQADRRWHYNEAIKNGATWLLGTFKTNQGGVGGWYPNPAVRNPRGDFAGLTAQVLFVLHRAEDAFPHLAANPALERAQSEFLQLAENGGNGIEPIQERDVAKNGQAHDSDRYFPGLQEILPDWKGFYAESSTFLWYPWSLMALSEIEQDSADDPAVQRKARILREVMLRRSSEAVKMASDDAVIYPAAEILFALNVALSKMDVRETLS